MRRAAIIALILLAGCGGDRDRDEQKLLVIAIDSADWNLWRPMLAEGQLPHLQSFMTEATSGRMQSFKPFERSPTLWASILTGTVPDVHGVFHFVQGVEQQPVQGAAWGAPAIWDILGPVGKTTSIAGMWQTYPARPIPGVMVSDYLHYGQDLAKPLANLVAPDSLTELFVSMRVDPRDISHEQLTRFIDPEHIDRAWEKHRKKVKALREIWAADLGYMAVNRHLAEGDDFDFFFVYLRGPDMVSHQFYEFLAPEKSPTPVDPEDIEMFADVVPRYYEWIDEALGEILAWFPPDRQVVILSDHGFHGPRPLHKGTAQHHEYGVFLVRSPHYVAGSEFDLIPLMDIGPTFMALLGLPPAGDMPGAVFSAQLTPSGETFVRRIEGSRIPSYQALRPVPGAEGERNPVVDEEVREQLKSLGYIN